MVWQGLIVGGLDWRAVLAKDDGSELQTPASADEVGRVEALLVAVFAADLRALYLVSDGVFDKAGQWFVVWPLAKVVERNQSAWVEGDVTRRQLVGFGDDGAGAVFCVPRDGDGGVFVWGPIDQQAYRLAGTVAEFWSGWAMGMITT